MADDVEQVWTQIYRLLVNLPKDEREHARRLLRRRLAHPEVGGNPQLADCGTSGPIHPRGTGRTAANEEPKRCVCGVLADMHDDDGHYVPGGCETLVLDRYEIVR